MVLAASLSWETTKGRGHRVGARSPAGIGQGGPKVLERASFGLHDQNCGYGAGGRHGRPADVGNDEAPVPPYARGGERPPIGLVSIGDLVKIQIADTELRRPQRGSTSRHRLACFFTKHEGDLQVAHEHKKSATKSSFRKRTSQRKFSDLDHLGFVSACDGFVSAAVSDGRTRHAGSSTVARGSSCRVPQRSYGILMLLLWPHENPI